MVIQLLKLLEISLSVSLWSLSCSVVLVIATSPSLAKPNCPTHCGNIEIPFPFGIGSGCFQYNKTIDYNPAGYEIICDKSTNPPKPFLNISNTSRPEVLDISLSGTLRVNNPIFFSDCANKTNRQPLSQLTDLTNSPFSLSYKNKFTSVSCGRVASLQMYANYAPSAVCLSLCDNRVPVMENNTCGGVNCCQTSIRFAYFEILNATFGPSIDVTDGTEETCKYAFLVDPEWFASNSTNISAIADMDYVPLLLRWGIYREAPNGDYISVAVDNSTEDNMNTKCDAKLGYCLCSKGYEGNPYLHGGCQDINECNEPRRPNICGQAICSNNPGGYACHYNREHRSPQPYKLIITVLCSVFGSVFAIIGMRLLHKKMKKRKNERRKQKFYIQNGGLLLEKLLSSGEINVEKIKLFDAKELKKATDQFNIDRVVGEGGQGTVYKGMLTDGRIVAVKKSKVIDGGDVSQFINEIVILSQINHRNVVKILGCCLESEVPLLVYEFLPNGTLSQYIQSRDVDFPLTWDVRLQVSLEVAGALSYLHSSVSMPIYHRDIKSSNILLDEKYRAKVADFGTSRSVSIEKTHLTMTHVNGTFGYLDPEYFQSNQFSDKSDVYSFGVILAELLTEEKPLSLTRSRVEGKQDGRSLATYFMDSIKENCLFDILDAEVLKGAKKSEIMVMANLAKRCLNMKGKKRPSMKEVTLVLEGIVMSKKSSDVEHNVEVEYKQAEIAETWDAGSSSTGPHHLDISSSFEVQSLLSFKSQ